MHLMTYVTIIMVLVFVYGVTKYMDAIGHYIKDKKKGRK